MDLERIQQALRTERLDGWLFYDFRKSNPIAYQVLGLSHRRNVHAPLVLFCANRGNAGCAS